MYKRLEVMCVRDLVKSEGWSRESFLEAMSERRLPGRGMGVDDGGEAFQAVGGCSKGLEV